jgi:hypothetical protein
LNYFYIHYLKHLPIFKGGYKIFITYYLKTQIEKETKKIKLEINFKNYDYEKDFNDYCKCVNVNHIYS